MPAVTSLGVISANVSAKTKKRIVGVRDQAGREKETQVDLQKKRGFLFIQKMKKTIHKIFNLCKLNRPTNKDTLT